MVKPRYYARKKNINGAIHLHGYIYHFWNCIWEKGLVKETKSSKMLKVGLIAVYCLMCRLKID